MEHPVLGTLYLIVLVKGLYLQQVDLSMFREQLLNHITSNFYQEGFATTKSRLRLHLQRVKPPDLFLLQDQPLLLCYQLLVLLIKGKFFESSSIYFQSFKLETKELFSNTMLAGYPYHHFKTWNRIQHSALQMYPHFQKTQN